MRKKKLRLLSEHPTALCQKVRFLCFCGKESVSRAGYLLGENTKSCGCLHGELHGETDKTPEYKAWLKMKERCDKRYYKNSKFHYADRGITVCEEWKRSYVSFLNHVGRKPTPAHTLDRVDNSGNYEPGNVRWATRREQTLNSRHAKFVTFGKKTLCLLDWDREMGYPNQTIGKRLRRGWPLKLAIETKPVRNHKVMFRYKEA